MTVGIIGLGLIGGSLAKAYKAAGHKVFASDIDRDTLKLAIDIGAVDAPLENAALQSCELILIALYPQAAIDFLKEASALINSKAFVIDCCGTKRGVCAIGFELAKHYGYTFVGGHPMAGTEHSGFSYSKAELFKSASMIIVPPTGDNAIIEQTAQLLAPAQFGRLTVTTAEKHDAMIAFTSQMAHLVSNAFIKSPTLREHEGFSAGSYKDLTRVAWLNEHMWAELFLENRENLLYELDIFLAALQTYRKALETEDIELLEALLLEGKQLKEAVG